jgi:hypothetical protein
MSDRVYLNESSCKKYVDHEEELSKLAARDEQILPFIASLFQPNKDKVQVAIGCGGGRDFKEDVLGKDSKIVRKIGLDYSSYMLKLCKEKYPHVEVIKDDMRSLKKLKKYLRSETGPIIFTLLTNSLGNLEMVDRRRSLMAIRDCMKDEDLLISELYRHPIEVARDPNLIPENFINTKVRTIDFSTKELGTAIPLYKMFPYVLAAKNPELSWILHVFDQQAYYAEMDFIRNVIGQSLQTNYNFETNNIEVYRPRDRKSVFLRKTLRKITGRNANFSDYFDLVLFSHRWTGTEMARDFMEAGLIGNCYAGQTMYIPCMIRYNGNKDFKSACERYDAMFPGLAELKKDDKK